MIDRDTAKTKYTIIRDQIKRTTVTGATEYYNSIVKEISYASIWTRFCKRYNIPPYIKWLELRIWRENNYVYEDDTADHGAEARRIFFSTILERIKSIFSNVNKYFRKTASMEEERVYAKDPIVPDPSQIRENQLHSYWVGHATQIYTIPVRRSGAVSGFAVATDIVDGHLNPVLYRRLTHPGILAKNYPKIDILVISHNRPLSKLIYTSSML